MDQNKKHKILLQKLHDGTITESDLWSLERDSLDDPFLADAIEGYYNNDVKNKDRRKFAITKGTTKVKKLPWYRPMAVAASLVILIGFTFLMNRDNNMALQTQDVIAAEQSESSSAYNEVREAEDVLIQEEDEVIIAENETISSEGKNQSHESKKIIRSAKKQSSTQSQDNTNSTKNFLPEVAEDVSRYKTPQAKSKLNKAPTEPMMASDMAQDIYSDKSKSKNWTSSEMDINEGSDDIVVRENNERINAIDGIPLRQSGIIKGRVLDEQGAPIIAAELQTVSSDSKAITDSSGAFVIAVSDMNESITAKSLGYAPSTMSIEPELSFELKKAEQNFSEPPLLLVETMDDDERKREYARVLDNYITTPILICQRTNNDISKVRMRIEISETGYLINLDYVTDGLSLDCQTEIENLIRQASFENIFKGRKSTTFLYILRF